MDSHSLFTIRTPSLSTAPNAPEPDTYLLFQGKGLCRIPTRAIALDLLQLLQLGERTLRLQITYRKYALILTWALAFILSLL